MNTAANVETVTPLQRSGSMNTALLAHIASLRRELQAERNERFSLSRQLDALSDTIAGRPATPVIIEVEKIEVVPQKGKATDSTPHFATPEQSINETKKATKPNSPTNHNSKSPHHSTESA